MRITEIENIRQMMEKLLLKEDLDGFLLVEAVFNTRSRTELDGALNQAFFDDDEREALHGRRFAYWGELRAVARELLTGKRLPVSFRIALMKETEEPDKCMLTFMYRENKLSLVSAMNHESFTMDREAERAWDEEALKLLEGWLEE